MSENENNFESLRRLLVLKRYETPPPGYFNYFSSQVLSRIRAGDPGTANGWVEDLFRNAPWLERLVQALDVRPVYASAFAGALCLLLFIGIIYADRPELTSQPMVQVSTASATALAAATPSLSQAMDQMGIVSSTNPVLSLQPVATLFGQQSSLVQPVSFSIPAN